MLHEDAEGIKASATVAEPKSIPLRSKRINGLGNAVVPAIPEAIFRVITKYEKETYHGNYTVDRWKKYDSKIEDMPKLLQLNNGEWHSVQQDLFNGDNGKIAKLPSRGFVANGVLYSDGKNDPVLNAVPQNTQDCITRWEEKTDTMVTLRGRLDPVG